MAVEAVTLTRYLAVLQIRSESALGLGLQLDNGVVGDGVVGGGGGGGEGHVFLAEHSYTAIVRPVAVAVADDDYYHSVVAAADDQKALLAAHRDADCRPQHCWKLAMLHTLRLAGLRQVLAGSAQAEISRPTCRP